MLISSAVVLHQSRREQTDFGNLQWASNNPAWDSGQNRAQNPSTGFASLEHDWAIRDYLLRNAGKHSLYLGPRLSPLVIVANEPDTLRNKRLRIEVLHRERGSRKAKEWASALTGVPERV